MRAKTIDEQYKDILLKIIKKTYKDCPNRSSSEELSKTARQVREKMRSKGQLDIVYPDSLTDELKSHIAQTINQSYGTKFGTGISSFCTAITSDVKGPKAGLASCIDSIQKAQSIAGEPKLVNNLDILQQSNALGCHDYSVIDVNKNTVLNVPMNSAISRLAGYVIGAFQKEFGTDDGLAYAQYVWKHYPWAINDSAQAEAVAAGVKSEAQAQGSGGLVHIGTVLKNSVTLSEASKANLTNTQSLLQTDGLGAGFLHRNVVKAETGGLGIGGTAMTYDEASALLGTVNNVLALHIYKENMARPRQIVQEVSVPSRPQNRPWEGQSTATTTSNADPRTPLRPNTSVSSLSSPRSRREELIETKTDVAQNDPPKRPEKSAWEEKAIETEVPQPKTKKQLPPIPQKLVKEEETTETKADVVQSDPPKRPLALPTTPSVVPHIPAQQVTDGQLGKAPSRPRAAPLSARRPAGEGSHVEKLDQQKRNSQDKGGGQGGGFTPGF